MAEAGSEREQADQGLVPGRTSSRWVFNWAGAVPLVLIVVLAVGAWQWLGSDGDADDEVAQMAGSPGADGGAAAAASPDRSTVPTTTVPVTEPVATTVPPVTTTPVAAALAPTVLITGEMKPCRFGSNCLVASFTIEGFDPHPGRFVCIYPNSERDFTFNGPGVEDACLTADAGDTLTIEVGGVRSATISESDLTGAGSTP